MSFDVEKARSRTTASYNYAGTEVTALREWLDNACDEIERLRTENEELAMRMYYECVPKGAANEQIAKDQEIMRKWFAAEMAEKTLEIERLEALVDEWVTMHWEEHAKRVRLIEENEQLRAKCPEGGAQ